MDARREDGEPSLCGYDAYAWKPVLQKPGTEPTPDAQVSPLAKVFAEIPARKVWTAPNGDTLADFGQNMAGVIRVEIHGQAGEEITFEHGEVLDQDGNFTYAFEGDETRAQKDSYICAGTGKEIFSPQFTYHGFRYVQIRGGKDWKKEQLTALAISTENPVTGEFCCSDERLNQLQSNIYWSQCSNNITIPTDCPTREKAGWTGDVVVYGMTAFYNQDMTAFYEDWLKSIRLEQTENGHVLNTGFHFGDWLVPSVKNAEGFSDGPASAFLTMNYVDTALLAADADLFAEASELLGYMEKQRNTIGMPRESEKHFMKNMWMKKGGSGRRCREIISWL